MTEAPRPTRHSLRGVLIVVALTAAGLGVGFGIGSFRNREPDTMPAASGPQTVAGVDRGEVLFQTMCASCHGPEGHGDGDSAAELHPPPRDFAARPWRTEVSPKVIRRVILDGIPGTAMPGYRSALSSTDADVLTEHVYRLATDRTSIPTKPSEEQRLLREGGFVELQGAEPPALTLINAEGSALALSDLKGQWVLIHFWGTACLPCLAEMPHLEALAARSEIRVLHVCVDTADVIAAQELANRVAPGATAWIDKTGLGPIRFEALSLPTVWLIRRDGRAIGRATGAKDWTSPELRRLVEHFASESPD